MDFDPYAVFAQFYDLEFDAYDDDLELYRQFAERAEGPVLELGCGSGRVLSALIAAGITATGVDSSTAMLGLARQRLGHRARLILDEMSSLENPELQTAGPYALIFAAINTFLHLPDSEAQLACLAAAKSLIAPGGFLLLDLLVPTPDFLLSLDGRLLLEFSTPMGTSPRLDKFVTRGHDLASQTIISTVYYDLTAPDGTLRRQVNSYLTRYVHRFEAEHLLDRAGWNLVSTFGDYELGAFDSESERMILLATPKPDERSASVS